LYSEDIHDVYCTKIIIKVTTLRRKKWMVHAEHTGETINTKV